MHIAVEKEWLSTHVCKHKEVVSDCYISTAGENGMKVRPLCTSKRYWFLGVVRIKSWDAKRSKYSTHFSNIRCLSDVYVYNCIVCITWYV